MHENDQDRPTTMMVAPLPLRSKRLPKKGVSRMVRRGERRMTPARFSLTPNLLIMRLVAYLRNGNTAE